MNAHQENLATPWRAKALLPFGPLAVLVLACVSVAGSLAGEVGSVVGVVLLMALVCIPFAENLLVIFFGSLIALCSTFGEISYSIGFRVYGGDAIFYFLGAGLLFFVYRSANDVGGRSRLTTLERRLLLILGLHVAFGAFLMVFGLAKSNLPNEVLGNFRRLYAYPIAIVLPFLLPLKERHIGALRWAIWIGVVCIGVTAIYRMITGTSFRPDLFVFGTTYEPDPRLLGPAECTTLCLGIAYATAILKSNRHNMVKLLAVCAAAWCALFLLLSGWRLSALYALAIPVGALGVMMWIERQGLKKLFGAVLVFLIIAAAVATPISLLFREKLANTYEAFSRRQAMNSFTGGQRYWTWKAGLGEFSESPVIGNGLGHPLHVFIRATDGQFLYSIGSTHSTPLSILYQGGSVGLALYVSLHTVFLLFITRCLRKLRADVQPEVVALIFFYLACVGFSLLQPLTVGSIVSLHLAMALAIHLCRTQHHGMQLRHESDPK